MTSQIKVIKSEQDLKEALALVEEIMCTNPDPDTEDGEKLNLLALLIQDYEAKSFPQTLPDPIDAIVFRMEQQGLKPIDLIPFIGSKSKVSETLSRKRPLTLTMIKALEAGLGIPAKVLLNESDNFKDFENITWNRFPIKEMEKRGYFGGKTTQEQNINIIIKKFFQSIQPKMNLVGMLRKTNFRSTRPMDKHALVAWSARVIQKAENIKNVPDFKQGTINLSFLQELAKLSINNNGPLDAIERLKVIGIIVIIEPHFPQTYLDGAVLFGDKRNPIIGLTLRMDRLDNFWFTLMHELAHISLHANESLDFFYDDLDKSDLTNTKEQEADTLALESMIPKNKWESSPAKLIPSPIAAECLAKELGIHIAIVAGRMRHEEGRYAYLNPIVNGAKIRNYFPNELWKK